MKRSLTIAIAAILAFALILSGCSAPATPVADEPVNPARAGYTAARVDATAVGTGYRGGNGNARGGNTDAGSLDNCAPANGTVATADPDYDLTEAEQTLSLSGYGAEGALRDESLTLADMLTYAIQDEYLARAEYDRIISDYGSIRPFTNIIRAEETHIDALLPLFTAYGITTPANEGADHVVSIPSLAQTYQAGVNAEVNNIAMYELFLDEELPDNVRTVFESLMRASENHLHAFQNQL